MSATQVAGTQTGRSLPQLQSTINVNLSIGIPPPPGDPTPYNVHLRTLAKRPYQYDEPVLFPESDDPVTAERKLSDNELSYYLPSRADGVNDMYVHYKISFPPYHLQNRVEILMDRQRVLYIWSLLLLRNPLLASRVTAEPDSPYDASFKFARPTSVQAAVECAEWHFTWVTKEDMGPRVDILGRYLNGPRTLSADRQSQLVILPISSHEFEIMLCATHYIGDGVALHTLMDNFFRMLGQEAVGMAYLQRALGNQVKLHVPLPPSLENRLPRVGGGFKLAEVVSKVDTDIVDHKVVGGQTIPRDPRGLIRHTLVRTFHFSAAQSRDILRKIKTRGCSLGPVLFALCNVAWARTIPHWQRFDPCLIYSAINLRPNMIELDGEDEDEFSPFHLAIGYYNIILPTVIPRELSLPDLFWHRATMVKNQTRKVVKSPMLISRAHDTALIRRQRAVGWAKVDDEAAAAGEKPFVSEPDAASLAAKGRTSLNTLFPGDMVPPGIQLPPSSPAAGFYVGGPVVVPPVSQRALMGVSVLGDLDRMYDHEAYLPLRVDSLTTGSRQRQGGLLLFAYVFQGEVHVSLGYDSNGFEEGVVEAFWREVQVVAGHVLLND